MKKYVILLRGINVGGNKKVPMSELKKMFMRMGFENIQTILNSGNVIFDARTENELTLTQKIRNEIENTFGFAVNVMLRSANEIKELFRLEPFKNIEVDKNTRLYVTFLSEESTSKLKIPYIFPNHDFKILQKTNRELFSVLNLDSFKSVQAMAFLEKEFGKEITT